MTVDLLYGEGFPPSAMKVKGEGVPPLFSSGGWYGCDCSLLSCTMDWHTSCPYWTNMTVILHLPSVAFIDKCEDSGRRNILVSDNMAPCGPMVTLLNSFSPHNISLQWKERRSPSTPEASPNGSQGQPSAPTRDLETSSLFCTHFQEVA